MNRDRGNIKWNSAMMLPEFAKLLYEAKEEFEKEDKPELDEQYMMEIQQTINMAIEHDSLLEIHYFNDGHTRSTQGHMMYIDYQTKNYRFECVDGETYVIYYE